MLLVHISINSTIRDNSNEYKQHMLLQTYLSNSNEYHNIWFNKENQNKNYYEYITITESAGDLF